MARIIQERIPKKCAYNDNAHMDLDDQLNGKSLIVYEASCRPLPRNKTSGYSGTHSNGYLETKDKTYAELTEPFENLVNSLTKQQAALSVKQQATLPVASEERPKRRKDKPRHQKPAENIQEDLIDSE